MSREGGEGGGGEGVGVGEGGGGERWEVVAATETRLYVRGETTERAEFAP